MKRLVMITLTILVVALTLASTKVLVIGVGEYNDTSVIQLPGAVKDAEAFSEIIGRTVDNPSVKLIKNPTLTGLKVSILEWARTSEAGDTLILYYSGHGYSIDNDTYLIPSDVETRYIEETAYNFTTGLKSISAEIRAKDVLIIIDACYSGSLVKDDRPLTNAKIKEGTIEEIAKDRGYVFLLSSRSNETSKERPEGGGQFTYYLLKGIEGEANRDNDEEITVSEVYEYLREEVRKATSNNQTPVLLGDREIVIAKDLRVKYESLAADITRLSRESILDSQFATVYMKILLQKETEDTPLEARIRGHLVDYASHRNPDALIAFTKVVYSEFGETTKDTEPTKVSSTGNCILKIIAGNEIGKKGTVYFNGGKAGTLENGQLEIYDIAPGNYLLIIDDPEIALEERTIIFENDYEIKEITFYGQTPTRIVRIMSTPSGARAYMDGEEIGTTPIQREVKVGKEYEIEVYLEKYGRKTTKINVGSKGEPIILDIQIPQNPPPVKPTAVTPESGATGIPWGNVVLNWKSGNEELTYSLQYGESPAAMEELTKTKGTEYTVSAPERGKTYYWKVTATNSFQQETTSDLLSFTTKENAPPTAPKLTAPPNNETTRPEGIVLRWDRSTDADGDTVQYQVYFGEGKLTLVITQSGTQYTPTGIERGKEYTWKVVAVDSLGAKSESPVYTFKTKPNSSPTVPNLTFPTDKSQISVEQAKLSWDRSTDADGDSVQFQVYFGEGRLTLVSTQNGTQYTPIGIERGKEYTWKVVAVDSLGAKSESPVYTFKTILNRPPEKPNLTAPYNKTTVDYKTVTFIWNCNDPDKDTLEYELNYWEKGNTTKKVTTKTTQYLVRDLQPASTYEWKVIATDTYGAKMESNIQTFNTVENRPPNRPGIVSPSNEEKNVDPKAVKLKWNCGDPDEDPLKYDVYFGTSRDKLSLIKSNITEKEANPGALKDGTTYYWKVTVNDGNENTVESEIWEFKTKPPVDPLLLTMLGVGVVGLLVFVVWYFGI